MENAQTPISGMLLVKALIEGRQAKGFSQEDVANELRVSTDIIKKIEASHYNENEMTVYIKGYFRAYAKLVGVDLQEVDHYFASLGVLNKPPMAGPATFKLDAKRKSLARRVALIAFVCVIVFLIIAWVKSQESDSTLPATQEIGAQ